MTLETGWQVAIHESATSTSDVIFSYEQLCEGQAVLARQQTQGRGRHGRSWSSERDDGMYLSLALQPKQEMRDWPSLSFIAALALFLALKDQFPDLPAGLKWPNDVLVNRKKLSGILLEAKHDMVVVGCGVNLKNAPQLGTASFVPTDIATETGTILDPIVLATGYLTHFYNLYQTWQISGFSAHYDLYRSHLLFIGETISVKQAHGQKQGIMRGVDMKGDLLLEDASGTIVPVTTGDVNLLGFSDAISD